MSFPRHEGIFRSDGRYALGFAESHLIKPPVEVVAGNLVATPAALRSGRSHTGSAWRRWRTTRPQGVQSKHGG